MRQLHAMDGVFAYQYTPAAQLCVSDEDSADFLQSQFSNDLRPFEPGQVVYGLWLDVKGKVIADSWVLCEGEEAFRMFSEHSSSEVITEKLERHIIADDVVIDAQEGGAAIALIGEHAGVALEQLGIAIPESGLFSKQNGIVCIGGRRALTPSYELFCTDAVSAELSVKLEDLGVALVSEEWIQLQRMEAGIPQVPQEVGASDLPGEGGFVEDAVSLNKGCYLGQEVVARMHNVGQARRGLYLVEGEGALPETPADLLSPDGKMAGQLRSLVQQDASWIGVAMLKIRSAGELLSLESGEAVNMVRPLRISSNS